MKKKEKTEIKIKTQKSKKIQKPKEEQEQEQTQKTQRIQTQKINTNPEIFIFILATASNAMLLVISSGFVRFFPHIINNTTKQINNTTNPPTLPLIIFISFVHFDDDNAVLFGGEGGVPAGP